MDITAINRGRIVYYGVFAALFSSCLDEKAFQTAAHGVDILGASPMDERSGKALANIKRRLDGGGYSALKKENDRIFYDPTSTFVPMTASYYAEERDDGAKRLEMIGYVLESKFRRNAAHYHEHEDHIEFILLFIQRLIDLEIQGEGFARQLATKVFTHILNPMIDQFANALLQHETSFFYKQAALALQSFIEFERLYLNIPPPEPVDETRAARQNSAEEKEQSRECVKFDIGG